MEFCVFRDMIWRDLRGTTGKLGRKLGKTGVGKRAGGMAGSNTKRARAGVRGEASGSVALHSC